MEAEEDFKENLAKMTLCTEIQCMMQGYQVSQIQFQQSIIACWRKSHQVQCKSTKIYKTE